MIKAVVSFADGTGSYFKKMMRLGASLNENFDGSFAFLPLSSYAEINNCEHHSVIPYKFKPESIAKARETFDLVLWCDSPVYAKKPIQPVFDHIEKFGYLFFDNIGFSVGDFTNDKTLKYFGVTRREAFDIKMIMACCMGFDFRDKSVGLFFDEYRRLANDLYPGEWTNIAGTESTDMRVRGHRHDQSVMSLIIHKEKLNIMNAQQSFFAYESHREVMAIADSVCLFSG